MPNGRSGSGLPIGAQIIGGYLEDRSTIAFARLPWARVRWLYATADFKAPFDKLLNWIEPTGSHLDRPVAARARRCSRVWQTARSAPLAAVSGAIGPACYPGRRSTRECASV